MTVRYFRHDHAGAPILTGQAGSLTSLLRTCLVGVAGVAYGSQPAAGWSESFSGTGFNVATFRNASGAGASGCYVRINDNAPGSAGAREARMIAYAAMTDVNTGTFPTTEVFVHKSNTLDGVARNWLLAADERTFWLYVWSTGENDGGYRDSCISAAGDYECFDPANAYRYMVLGRSIENATSNQLHKPWLIPVQTYVGQSGFSLPSQTGIGGPFTAAMIGVGTSSNVIGSAQNPTGPDPVSGNYQLESKPLISSNGRAVGRLRGVAKPLVSIHELTRGALIAGDARWVALVAGAGTVSANQYIGGLVLDSTGGW